MWIKITFPHLRNCKFHLADPGGGSDFHFTAHKLAYKVSISIILTGVVALLLDECVGCQFLQPILIIMVQAGLIIIDEDERGSMHEVQKAEAILNIALAQGLSYNRCDVDQGMACRRLEQDFFLVAFYRISLSIEIQLSG